VDLELGALKDRIFSLMYRRASSDEVLQIINSLIDVLRQKKKAKTPIKESRPDCPLGLRCLNYNYEVGSGRLCNGCGR